MVRISVLGGVIAVTDGGEPVDIGPAKCRTVLAALALSAGSVVPVSRLVESVWDEDPPRTAEKTLQSYVVRLRKGLGTASIVRTGAAYRLAVDPDAVDVARFQRHLDAGDAASALAEWTGTPLAGLDGHGLAPVVDGLVEQWLSAVEIDLARRVETDAPAAIGPLTEITATHPFREGLWALLMMALYRAGRQADALAAFRRARHHLVDQLGVEPGPRLRDLESLILDHDDRLDGPASSGRPAGTVTFGFCEVEGSSELWATHRKKMAVAMARLDELVRAAATRHRGCVFASSGDSYGVAFHRAGDAAEWAVELQLEVGGEPWPGGIEVGVRIGLHTGETDPRATNYVGPAVHAAARIAGAAHGGQTLVSEVTSALLDRDDLPDVGTHRPAGEMALRLFQLGAGQHPPPRTADSGRGNLPLRSGRLIGRDDDLDVVVDALVRSPVVTLVGPGGIGKTRLALAVAHASGDDRRRAVWLVELAHIASSSDVPRAVADTLEITESAARTVTESVVATLRSRPALIVLDNCEHVVDGAAELARAVAETCRGTRLLATSREALGVPDEHLIAVAPLDPVGPGAELFTERARAVSPTFDRHAHRTDIEEICRRVDGIPLAIELAAARMTTLTPADMVGRLGNRLRLLTGGRRTSAERHRTLRSTIAWSYDLLTRPQQVHLGQLSIFTGSFDLGAARSVTADDEPGVADVDDLLGDLVERSMLTVESGPHSRRFRLLETVREFAAERRSADGDDGAIARRHARWCSDQVTHIHRMLVGPAEVEGVARLAELWPNLRAAFDWACVTGDRELAGALVRPVAGEVNLRRQTEVSEWAERILARTPPAEEEQIVFWLAVAAHRYQQIGDLDGFERLLLRYGEPDHALIRYARAHLDDDGEAMIACSAAAVAWLHRSGDHHAAALTEVGGAAGLLSTGRFGELDAVVSDLADRYRAEGPPTLLYVALTLLGYSAFFQGEPERAGRLFDESAAVDVPDRTISVNAPVDARSAFRRGDRARAFRILRSHVDELLRSGYTDLASNAAVEFVNMMASIDRLDDAAPVVAYLAAAGDFGALAVRTLVADAADRIAADTGLSSDGEHPPDTHQALEHMRDVLDHLDEVRPSDRM